MTESFIRSFESSMELEATLRPLTLQVRQITSALGSPFSYARVDALKRGIQLFIEWSAFGGTTAHGEPCDVVQTFFVPRQLLQKPPAPSWSYIQLALRNINISSSVFHRIFPRRDLLFQPGAVQVSDMTEHEALHWSTLVVPRKPPVPGGGGPAAPPPPGAPAMPAPNAASRPREDRIPFFEPLRTVTLVEQELAMRFLQGVSNLIPSQKEFIGESPLLPLFAETLMCLKQHIDALWEQQQQQQQQTCGLFSASGSGAFERHGSGSAFAATLNSTGLRSGTADALSSTTTTAASAAGAQRNAPVRLNAALEATIAAMIDAVEAACHYQPRSLVILVTSGALKAALNIALCSHAPRDVRCSLLDTLSVLLQEIAPFRRLAAAPSFGAANQPTQLPAAVDGNDADVQRDTLTCMLDAARGGNVASPLDLLLQTSNSGLQGSMTMSPGTAGTSGHPVPFAMDRASASKFDSAIRDILSQRRLLGILPQLTSLRDVRGVSVSITMPRAELHRLLHKGQRERERKLHDILAHIDELQIVEGLGATVAGPLPQTATTAAIEQREPSSQSPGVHTPVVG